MPDLKIWFPGYYTEAHRQEGGAVELVEELKQLGIKCYKECTPYCKFVLCGSFFKFKEVREFARVPVFHFNWDIYPFQVEGGEGWKDYLVELEKCAEIWVPSQCTVKRTEEYTGRSAYVIKAPVKPFSEPVTRGKYVLDIMRKYPDPNRDAAKRACDELGIPIVESKTNLHWNDYKRKVANAAFLISAQYEASTGGLSLLEGYALGKPVLLSNSPRHGGVDYFGDRANYFQWDDESDLKAQIKRLYETPQELDPAECLRWVASEYSERVFAKNIADRIFEYAKRIH